MYIELLVRVFVQELIAEYEEKLGALRTEHEERVQKLTEAHDAALQEAKVSNLSVMYTRMIHTYVRTLRLCSRAALQEAKVSQVSSLQTLAELSQWFHSPRQFFLFCLADKGSASGLFIFVCPVKKDSERRRGVWITCARICMCTR
jgi:hypothetical protein